MKQKLEETEANEQLKQAKGKRALVEVASVSHSELIDEINELPNIDKSLKFVIALLTLFQEIFLNQT